MCFLEYLINLQGTAFLINFYYRGDPLSANDRDSAKYLSFLLFCFSQDMVPPKDPYIKVRVLDDIGNVVLSDQLANLARHAILFIRRTDAEQYISQVIFPYNRKFHEK